MKASAVAYPIQGLVKYHGFRDPALRIPWHDSISLCTAPTRTHTTVQAHDGQADVVVIDGDVVTGRALERCVGVLNEVRRLKGDAGLWFSVRSQSNFPKYVGLGSSSSGFAALALAASRAAGLPTDPERVSQIARLGAGSAARSVAGGWADWVTEGDGRSYARQLAGPGDLPWATVALVVQHPVPTENAHEDAESSPFYQPRVDHHVGLLLQIMRKAIERGDSEAVMKLAERDTLNLHAVTMTGQDGLVAWRGPTVEAIHAVRDLRKDRIPAYFSIDTGATVYVNTFPEHVDAVTDALAPFTSLDRPHYPDTSIIRLDPAPAAALTDQHLM